MVLSQEGCLYAFGYNRDCQLGFGPDSKCVEIPTIVPSINTNLHEQIKVQQISCGFKHTVALSECKQLWGCGSNKRGQLGEIEGDQVEMFKQIPTAEFLEGNDLGDTKLKCSWNNTAVYCQNKLWITGCNRYGQLG